MGLRFLLGEKPVSERILREWTVGWDSSSSYDSYARSRTRKEREGKGSYGSDMTFDRPCKVGTSNLDSLVWVEDLLKARNPARKLAKTKRKWWQRHFQLQPVWILNSLCNCLQSPEQKGSERVMKKNRKKGVVPSLVFLFMGIESHSSNQKSRTFSKRRTRRASCSREPHFEGDFSRSRKKSETRHTFLTWLSRSVTKDGILDFQRHFLPSLV